MMRMSDQRMGDGPDGADGGEGPKGADMAEGAHQARGEPAANEKADEMGRA